MIAVLANQAVAFVVDVCLALKRCRGRTVVVVLENYLSGDLVIPQWYTQTRRNNLQTTPLYNFAIFAPIGSKLVIGFTNRLIFDYKPFRSVPSGDPGNEDKSMDYGIPTDLEPQRLESDNNQQTVLGAQSEILAGYKLSKQIDIGFRLGHYFFDREGKLFDSKWANYPHSSSANLNDESFNMDGDHIETGMGLLFHLNKKTRLGFYGSFMNGTSSEKIASLDSAKTWYERDTDTTYYQINHPSRRNIFGCSSFIFKCVLVSGISDINGVIISISGSCSFSNLLKFITSSASVKATMSYAPNTG